MKLVGFQIQNYRNILDSGWINLNQITAFIGQNEAGKSNLFEALYCLNPIITGADYNIDEDWPVDKWEGKREAQTKIVAEAKFKFSDDDIDLLLDFAAVPVPVIESADGTSSSSSKGNPSDVSVSLTKGYGTSTGFYIEGIQEGILDEAKAISWLKLNVPKFVYIRDYDMSGAQVELDQLQARLNSVAGMRHKLSNEDQTILIILDLAQINLGEFLQKGSTSQGRTIRSFDKRSASKYLTNQFSTLWTQKNVDFDIEVDGPTLNIFVEDQAVGMPVRLYRRSTGFRWYVSFAWKFTHATNGEYADCILLLEEPGVHLHYSGQRDLLKVFDRLAESNTILYTTHLASMIDLANPECVRIVESRNNHLSITSGIVSSQPGPMAVIEQSLGLTGDQSGLMSNRQVLIVEGGDDALILHKLSGLLREDGKEGLSDKIYIWPAQSASKTPMYAAFVIGQGWDAGVLLDTDEAGLTAKKKIEELYVSKLAEAQKKRFRIFMLGHTVGTKQTDFSIEDIFPESFYLDCTNSAFKINIKKEDLPVDGSDMITKRVETVLKNQYQQSEINKRAIFAEMLKQFDRWKKSSELPEETAGRAEKLFKAINKLFGP